MDTHFKITLWWELVGDDKVFLHRVLLLPSNFAVVPSPEFEVSMAITSLIREYSFIPEGAWKETEQGFFPHLLVGAVHMKSGILFG